MVSAMERNLGVRHLPLNLVYSTRGFRPQSFERIIAENALLQRSVVKSKDNLFRVCLDLRSASRNVES